MNLETRRYLQLKEKAEKMETTVYHPYIRKRYKLSSVITRKL